MLGALWLCPLFCQWDGQGTGRAGAIPRWGVPMRPLRGRRGPGVAGQRWWVAMGAGVCPLELLGAVRVWPRPCWHWCGASPVPSPRLLVIGLCRCCPGWVGFQPDPGSLLGRNAMFLMPCPHFSLPSHCRCMALGCRCQKCQRGARKSCPCPGGSRVCRSSSSRGSSGHFMPPGAPTIPCFSLCRDRWMEEPPLLEVPAWGVEPPGRSGAARTKDYTAACPAPG